jgi:GNAT superfamily N-acetyltransferase
VSATTSAPVSPTACTPDDLPAVIALVNSALREGSDQSMLTDYPLVYLPQNLPNIFVTKVAGDMAAEVPFIPRPFRYGPSRITIGIISPTATHLNHRRRGYGSACLNACIERMTALGIPLSILWTRVETFPFYEAAGYQAVRPMTYSYAIEKHDAARFAPTSDSIVPLDPSNDDQLATIRRMHAEESWGVCRTPDELRILMTLPKMTTLLACRNRVPRAYLVVSRATNKPGLIEGGGDPDALGALVRHALTASPSPGVVPSYGYVLPTRLADLLDRIVPDRRKPPTENMMVRVNDPARVIECFRPSSSVDAQQDRHLLAASLFGEHPERRVASSDATDRIAPIDLPIPMLDRS